MNTPLKTITGFSQLIQTLERGVLHADLTDEIKNVMEAMAEFAAGPGNHKAKGSLTLTLDFTMELDTVRILPTIKTKLPELPRRPDMMFVTPNNNLSLEHPSQHGLPFDDARVRNAMVVSSDTDAAQDQQIEQ